MIKKTLLNEIASISGNMNERMIKDFLYEQGDEAPLIQALGCKNRSHLTTIQYLLCCFSLQGEKTRSLEKEVQEQRDKIEILNRQADELLAENEKLNKLINTYNGALLQRARVKVGKAIAKKENITKEIIQRLQAEGKSIEEIGKELKCSRSTIWRRLKE